MPESWCKVASDLDSHPKIRRAGRLGREVFLFALRRNAMPGNPTPGMVAAIELDPWYVADQLQMTEAEAVTGVTACVTASLLERDGDSFSIIGWSDEWGRRPKTNAERQAKFREAHPKPKKVTKSNAPIVTSNASNAGEERRGEEIKIPESLPPRAPARAIPPSDPLDGVDYDSDDPRHTGRLALTMWETISAARVRVAAEIGKSAHPFPPINPASQPRGFRDLRERVREEGKNAPEVCRRVSESLIAQARKNQSIEWLSEKAFTEGAWITAKEGVPEWRGGARGTRSGIDAAEEAFDAMKAAEAS